MQNVVLVIHLIIALLLIGAVLIQRSEGGALGIGGGGGGAGGVMSGRGAATALQKATWALAAAFITTSLILTLYGTQDARDRGLFDEAIPPIEAPTDADGADLGFPAPAEDPLGFPAPADDSLGFPAPADDAPPARGAAPEAGAEPAGTPETAPSLQPEGSEESPQRGESAGQ